MVLFYVVKWNLSRSVEQVSTLSSLPHPSIVLQQQQSKPIRRSKYTMADYSSSDKSNGNNQEREREEMVEAQEPEAPELEEPEEAPELEELE